VIRVFIHAPVEFRVKRLMKAQKMSDIKEVKARIKESDQIRTRFIKEVAGVDWTDARNYHLCFDSSALDLPSITSMITDWVGKKEIL
jgi:cytidylate kinase